MTEVCPICGREHGGLMEEHHLKPFMFKSRDKEVRGNTIRIHRICHQKIHATLSEHELLNHYHTIERLTENEEIAKFGKWVAKKPVDFYDKNDDTKSRKRKRKR